MTETRQHRALTEGAGLLAHLPADRLEMRGDDRHRFLNGQVTCDVRDLAPGSLEYGFFTSRQGKIQADVTVLALEDRFWLELPPGLGGTIAEHLQKYLLADRVDLEPLTSHAALAVIGPRALEVLAAARLAGLPEEDRRHAKVDLFGVSARAVRRPLFTLPAVSFWLPKDHRVEVSDRLAREAGGAGLLEVEPTVLETVRVERGAPRFGPDFGPESFPQETGLDDAVSYTKGCYLGQEVVARIHYRGGVQRQLRGLVFHDTGANGTEPPATGAELRAGDRVAGVVGTAVRSPALGATVGLAILHKRVGPGDTLEVQGGGTAEVRELPLVE